MYTYLVITVFGAIFGVYTFHKQNSDLRIITIFLVLSALFFVFQIFSTRILLWSNNMAVGNTWILIQFIVMSAFYFYLTPRAINRTIQIIFFFIYLLITFYSFADLINLKSFLSLPRYASGLVFIFYSILTYTSLLKNPQEDLLLKPLFWINTSVFVFFSGTMVIYLFIEYLYVNYPEIQLMGWLLHNVLGIARVVLIAYAIKLHMKYKLIGSS